MIRGKAPPSIQALAKYRVTQPDRSEVIYQPLYDYQNYPAAGATSLIFFQIPQGQGGKTLEDTNMKTAGTLPTHVTMQITGIEVVFFPGGNVSETGANVANISEDVYKIMKTGALVFSIGSKVYLEMAPIMAFPPEFRVASGAALADTTTAAANRLTSIDYATHAGQVFEISPFTLESTQNFKVELVWPSGAVATPSGNAGRIGVILTGFQFRRSQ